MKGVIISILAITMNKAEIKSEIDILSYLSAWVQKDLQVRRTAQVGSFPLPRPFAKMPNLGMTSSLAIDWRSRGAPVRLCNPAPIEDRNAPYNMTSGMGHVIEAFIKIFFPFPLVKASPYLSRIRAPSQAKPESRV